ncbi:Copper homeostasis protein cutC like protein [Melipona quadrifasciata]|uniref:Copper homeostasis protein cutC homolog n=1 Tax=Melipona quadrifasciata TaxID=166423 RepID=A0A0N0BKC2_9HYME|nr:Copper homeostasis protein cutC like protein [Melipona quadrifasciata]
MEICIDSVLSGRYAITGGASRMAVCSMLSEGGLTPSAGFFQFVSRMSLIPCYAMLRTRPGDFIYAKDEMEIMKADVKVLKDSGADGFLFGALTEDGQIDVPACKLILSAASPLPVTFHRAFDQVADPVKSLKTLIDIGFKRVMTSGQKDTAEEGLELIKELVKESEGKVTVMAVSGVTKDNILKLHTECGVREFHASAKRKIETEHNRNRIKIGASESNYVMVTDKNMVAAMVALHPVPEEIRRSYSPVI